MICNRLRMFEGSAVFEIGGDAGSAKGVGADPCPDAGSIGAALDHAVDILLPNGLHQAGLAGRRFGRVGRPHPRRYQQRQCMRPDIFPAQ